MVVPRHKKPLDLSTTPNGARRITTNHSESGAVKSTANGFSVPDKNTGRACRPRARGDGASLWLSAVRRHGAVAGRGRGKFFQIFFLGARSALRAGSEKVAQALKIPNRQPRSVIIPYPIRRFKKMRIRSAGRRVDEGSEQICKRASANNGKVRPFPACEFCAVFPGEIGCFFTGPFARLRLPACEFFALLRRGSACRQDFFSHCARWFVCEYLLAARFQIRHFLTEKPPLQ